MILVRAQIDLAWYLSRTYVMLGTRGTIFLICYMMAGYGSIWLAQPAYGKLEVFDTYIAFFLLL